MKYIRGENEHLCEELLTDPIKWGCEIITGFKSDKNYFITFTKSRNCRGKTPFDHSRSIGRMVHVISKPAVFDIIHF